MIKYRHSSYIYGYTFKKREKNKNKNYFNKYIHTHDNYRVSFNGHSADCSVYFCSELSFHVRYTLTNTKHIHGCGFGVKYLLLLTRKYVEHSKGLKKRGKTATRVILTSNTTLVNTSPD